jgi:hypothetical protein
MGWRYYCFTIGGLILVFLDGAFRNAAFREPKVSTGYGGLCDAVGRSQLQCRDAARDTSLFIWRSADCTRTGKDGLLVTPYA